MGPVRQRPNDSRGFLHKRIFGGIKGGIIGLLGGGPLGALGGVLKGVTQVQTRTAGCPPGFTATSQGCVETNPPRIQPVPGIRGFFERVVPGGRTGFQVEPAMVAPSAAASLAVQTDFGEAVIGRYGAAIEPASRSQDIRVCPRGTVLGADGLCYNRRDISNKERFWPRGRRPLLTGGEMRCISVAASAAKKLQTKQKQLEALGMLKKPARRAAPKLLGPGHHAHVAHD